MTCPSCKGFCCAPTNGARGIRYGHDLTGVTGTHDCPDCDDGTYEVCSEPEPFVPPRTAEDERADVVALLERAATYPNPTAPFSRYVEMLVELIRDGEHVGASKKPSDGV